MARNRHKRSLLTLALAGIIGCGGGTITEGYGQPVNGGVPFDHADSAVPVASDGGVPAPADSGTGDKGSPTPVPDLGAPDATPEPPKPEPPKPEPPKPEPPKPEPPEPEPPKGGPGDACPCGGKNICIEGTCRAQCAAPTDACEAGGNCPADHACVTFSPTEGICMPAVKPGAACGGKDYCPLNHVCSSVNGSKMLCRPTCGNPGGNCNNGSSCMAALGGCNFCSGV